MAKTDSDFGGEINSFDIINGVSNAFDVEAFDEAIMAHGVQFIHWRAMRNPVGLVDRYDSRRPGEESGSSNGMIYTEAGCFGAIFSGNSKDVRAMDGGVLNAGVAQITPTRCYSSPDCSPVYLAPYDRLYLKEESVLVTHTQLVNAHVTGTDRLQFPCQKVLDIVDSRGNRYKEGDFEITKDGHIKWGSKQPGVDTDSMKGRVYSIRFLYRPYWYIDRLLHEIRVAQHENQYTGAREVKRMNQSALIQREYVFEGSENNPDGTPKTGRQNKAPEDGGFGPR